MTLPQHHDHSSCHTEVTVGQVVEQIIKIHVMEEVRLLICPSCFIYIYIFHFWLWWSVQLFVVVVFLLETPLRCQRSNVSFIFPKTEDPRRRVLEQSQLLDGTLLYWVVLNSLLFMLPCCICYQHQVTLLSELPGSRLMDPEEPRIYLFFFLLFLIFFPQYIN